MASSTAEAKQTPTDIRLRLLQAGYLPLPVNGKIPTPKAWQTLVHTEPKDIDAWGLIWPNAGNTGVLTGTTPVLDIDIKNPAAAQAVEELVRARFEDDADIAVRFGNTPKRAIPFRTDAPFKKIDVPLIAADGDKEQKLEFLGDGQQCVVDGVHPITQKPFVWFGRSLVDIPRDELPYINAEQARQLVEDITELLVTEHGYSVASKQKKPSGENDEHREPLDWVELTTNIINGVSLHDSALKLAASYIGKGMDPALALKQLHALMLASTGPHDGRWQERLDDLPRLVRSAEAKYGKPDDDAEWPEPDWSLLDDRRGTLPDFPLDVLTEPWRAWLQKAARGAGVTPAHVVVPLLAIASGLVGTARRVRASRSWCEPFPNWTAVVGFSGDGKTPGGDVSRRALSLIERNRKHKLGELQRAHEKCVETAKAAHKKWKAEVQEAVEAGNTAPEMPVQAVSPGPFVAPRLYVSNVTIERLVSLVEAKPRGALMICDELAGLFLNMGRYSNGSDKEFWLEAWNGGSYVQERQSRPPVTVDYLLVGMTGGFQPDKLARSFAGDDDGMYARILFAWPPAADYKPLSNNVADVEPEFQMALMRLIDLVDMDGETFTPKNVWLSDEAKGTFEHFRQFLHAGKTALEGREREWWAKGATHVLRLAGTLCYLDWAMRVALSALSDTLPRHGPEEIGSGFVAAAVKLWRDYFWPHTRAALRQVGISEQHANARRVLLWAQANGKTEVSLMDARREALKQQLDAEQTESLLDRLVKAGWLKKATEKTGGRARHRWTVNSQLLSSGGMQEVQKG